MKYPISYLIFCLVLLVHFSNVTCQRLHCPRDSFGRWPSNRVNTTQKLIWLRTAMSRTASSREPNVDAYIITSYDEHQSEFVADRDKRLEYISGFSGKGYAAVTRSHAALWTTDKYYALADQQLDCKWILLKQEEPKVLSLTEWLGKYLGNGYRVGADPKTVPNTLWYEWSRELEPKRIALTEVSPNLIDTIWTIDPPDYGYRKNSAFILPVEYAGDTWQNKVAMLRQNLTRSGCDAIIVTALEEIAWLLNIRGRDTPYNHFVRSYLIVTQNEIFWFVAEQKLGESVRKQLKLNGYGPLRVQVMKYESIFTQIRTLSQVWRKVLIPTKCVYSPGASQAIYSAVPPEKRFLSQSPIIFLKSKKNPTEAAGMRRANIRDSAILVDFLAFLEEQIKNSTISELTTVKILDQYRLTQNISQGTAFPTIAAYGSNGGQPYYVPTNATNREIDNQSTFILQSGGHYYDGTSVVTRTLHYGTPTKLMIDAYTNLLKGLIKFSTSKFPATVKMNDMDMIIRSELWQHGINYKGETGHGVGSFSTVKESPIIISYDYKLQRQSLKEGNFITCEPSYHYPHNFGVKIGNLLEVAPATEYSGDNSTRYLKLNEVTLVPLETKLIDTAALTENEVAWINKYHTNVMRTVGAELKRQKRMTGFYWLMEKTKEISFVCTSSSTSVHFTKAAIPLAIAFYLIQFSLG